MEDAHPLQWPAGRPRTADHARISGSFKGSANEVQMQMRDEIGRMGRHVVVSTNKRIRRDGGVYAGEKNVSATPIVSITFRGTSNGAHIGGDDGAVGSYLGRHQRIWFFHKHRLCLC
jgi:hypothetical protein